MKDFLRGFCATLAAAKMYPMEHPQVKVVVQKVFETLKQVLGDRDEFIMGIVDDEIVFEKEVLFDLSAMMDLFINLVKSKDIEKIYFYKGLKQEELVNFIKFLLTKDNEVMGDAQSHLSALNVQNIKVSHLTTPLEKKKKKFVSRSESYAGTLAELVKYFDKLADEGSDGGGLYLEIKFTLFNIMENLMGKHQEFLYLGVVQKYNQSVSHSLNVALLAMSFSSKLGFIQEHVLDVGVASLLHDIGSYFIAWHAEREQAIDKEHFLYYSQHPSLISAELLLRQVRTFGPLPVIVAYEQGLSYNPQKREGPAFVKDLQVTSMVISLCAFYDHTAQSLIQQRDYCPAKIYQIMKAREEIFHPQLFEKFFQVIGLWPVGSIVQLSDGRVAVVREQSETDKNAPKVEILPPQENKKEIVDLSQKDVTAKIERSLHPLIEGREYVKFVAG